MNEYYTSRITFWTKRVLEKCLNKKWTKKFCCKVLKLSLQPFFRVFRYKHTSSKSSQGRFYSHYSDRIFKIFDVTLQSKKGTFHHISIRGLFNEDIMDTIFYESNSDDEPNEESVDTIFYDSNDDEA